MSAEGPSADSPPASPSTLSESLARWAAVRGRASAIRHKSHGVWGAWTWSDLQAEVGRVAAALEARGFGVGDVVALATGLSAEALAVALAAQGLGGAVIWLEPDEVGERDDAPPDGGEAIVSPALPAARFGFARDEAALARLRARLGVREPWALGLFTAEHGAPPDDPASPERAYARVVAGAGEPSRAAPGWAQPSDAAVQVAGRARALTHSALITAARSWLHANPVGTGQRAFTWEAPTTEAAATFIAVWLVAGISLIVPEDRATADADRREAQPTIVAATRAAYERFEQRVADNLPSSGTRLHRIVDSGLALASGERAPASAARRLLSRVAGALARWLLRRPLRNVLGYRRAALALVLGESPPAASVQTLFARLGVPLRVLIPGPVADSVVPAATFLPPDRSTLFEPVLALSGPSSASLGKLS